MILLDNYYGEVFYVHNVVRNNKYFPYTKMGVAMLKT